MGQLWQRFWIWTRIVFWLFILVYLITFTYENHSIEATFWIFPYNMQKTTSLKLSFFAFLAGVISTLLVQTTVKTLRQLRDARERSFDDKIAGAREEERTRAAAVRAAASGEKTSQT